MCEPSRGDAGAVTTVGGRLAGPVLLAATMFGYPGFDAIRDAPRFQAILEGMGLAD